VAKATWFSIGVNIGKSLARVLFIPRALARGLAHATGALNRNRRLTLTDKVYLAFIGAVLLIFIVVFFRWVLSAPNPRMSSAERLARAKDACGSGSQCLNPSEAAYQLSKIPESAQEYGEAAKLWVAISPQLAGNTVTASQTKTYDGSERAADQAQRNFQGLVHDSFSCAESTENQPIVSFDGGNSWWKDDGRCADRLQKHRDEEAQASSYWSTTVRVDTDMDSFWLPDEERNCRTFPDDKGTVATVLCDATAHANHNIPVKFWGGVHRNTVSDWRCRREGDTFVCRATD